MNYNKEREELKQRIDEDIRTVYTDERKFNKFQVNEKLLFITNNLWDSFQKIIEPVRKSIQKLESDILVNRYNLDETLKKHCKSKEDFKRAEKDLIDVENNLDNHRKEMQKIEEHCNGEDAPGDLKRLPFWVFAVLMSIVGLAEMVVYFYVFQSQELSSPSTLNSTWEIMIFHYAFPLVMAFGFTVMMIWLAHKLGMMLRQYISIHKTIRLAYWIKFVVILIVVIGAVFATVKIRGEMFEIMYIQDKIVKMQDSPIDMSSMMGDDNTNGESIMDTADMTMDMGDDSMEMTMDDDGLDMSINKKETNVSHQKSSVDENAKKENTSLPKTEGELELLVSKLKGNLAKLFIVINLFIVVAGIFLSYEVHTSSIKYEALEGMIARLEKRKKDLLKIKNDYEKDLSKNEKNDLLNALKQYVESVNTFDEYSQIVKSLRVSIENIYIEMVYYMLGTMEEHNLLPEIDIQYIEQFSPEYLSNRFKDEWKLENIDIESDEVMHIHNIDQFIEQFQCNSDKEKEVKNV